MGCSKFALCVFTLVLLAPATSGDDTSLTLTVDVEKFTHITAPNYLSITISGGQLRKGLVGYDFGSEKLQNLAKGLQPADVRIGGTFSDFLFFDPSSDESNCVESTSWTKGSETLEDKRNALKEFFKDGDFYFTMSGKRWDTITKFCETVGWDILWDFSLLLSPETRWNESLAKEFLDYSASRGVKIPMFELGNEPNLYSRKFGDGAAIDASELVDDYRRLKQVVTEQPYYASSGIYAPGVNNLDHFNSPKKYLTDFLSSGGCDIINEVSLHHYYFKASDDIKPEDLLNVDKLNSLKDQLDFAYNISWPNCPAKKPVRFTETSTAAGGGVEGVTNAYAAGFMWLDKLGLAATYGVTRVFRQTFLKSQYALVTQRLIPNPDYYLSVIHKRLVEGPVFQVESANPNIRLYANCVSQRHYSYPDGAIVVYYLNIGSDPSTLSLGDFHTDSVDLFEFTPGDDNENVLLARTVKMNGQLLEMEGDELPNMEGVAHSGDVTMAGQTFGFIVIPDADVSICVDYHRNDDHSEIPC